MRVAQKVETIREDLGSYGTVLADDVEQAMLGRGYSMPGGTSQAETKAEPVRKMLKFERDLAKQINELLNQYRETQRELRLSPENIRKVVEVALALAEQPALIPCPESSRQAGLRAARLEAQLGGVCRGPGASPHEGHSPDHLRSCRRRWPGRRGAGRISNHRLVQMSLRLLRAEVWSVKGRKRLHRITARLVPNHRSRCAGGHRPCPARRHRRRQPSAPRGDHHGGRRAQGRPVLPPRTSASREAPGRGRATTKPTSRCRSTCWNCGTASHPPLAQSLEARMKDRTSGLQKKLARASRQGGPGHRGDPDGTQEGHRRRNWMTRSTSN